MGGDDAVPETARVSIVPGDRYGGLKPLLTAWQQTVQGWKRIRMKLTAVDRLRDTRGRPQMASV